MTMQAGKFILTTLLGSLLAVTAIERTEAQAVPAQPPEHAANPNKPDNKDEDKKKDKDKDNKKNDDPKQQQAKQQEKQRQAELQKQQEKELAQKRAQGAAAAQAEARFRAGAAGTDPEAATAAGRSTKGTSSCARNWRSKNAQILRQQNRIEHLQFQQQYEERLRAQRAQLSQARYDYRNDPSITRRRTTGTSATAATTRPTSTA